LYEHLRLTAEIAFADEQTAIFDEMRSKALQWNGPGAMQELEYVVQYYPSGTQGQRAFWVVLEG
jgi:hypothetical protein